MVMVMMMVMVMVMMMMNAYRRVLDCPLNDVANSREGGWVEDHGVDEEDGLLY